MLTFRTRWRAESDDWSADGASIVGAEQQAAIQAALVQGPILVRHWYYRGSCAPSLHLFEALTSFRMGTAWR